MASSDNISSFRGIDREMCELWLSLLRSLLSGRVINMHVYLDLVHQHSTYLVRSFLSWSIHFLNRASLFQGTTVISNPSALHQTTFINYLGVLIQHLVRLEVLSGGLLDGSEKAPIATLYIAFSPDRAARLRFLIAVVRYFVTTFHLMSNFSF
jgi:hypothetical protein